VNPIRRFSLFVLIPVLALVLSACGKTTGPNAPAATLGTDQIGRDELATSVSLFTFLGAIQQQPCGGTPEGDETQEAACTRFALSNLIQLHVVGAYATEHGLTVKDQDIQTAVAGLDQQFGKDKVDSSLATAGATREQLSDLARKFLLLQQVSKAVTEASVGEDQLRKQYEQQLADYTTVEADHILVKTEAEAEDIYRQVIRSGFTRDDFLALAKRTSIDPSAKQNSGALPKQVASQYVKPFAAAVLKLQPGEISRPVHSEFGWHVIRLQSKTVTSFDDAKDQLLSSASPTAFSDWIRSQVSSDGLVVDPAYGRFDPDTLTVVRISSTDPSASSSSSSSSLVTPSPSESLTSP
jgi:foldase protein PrsA